MKKHGVIIPCSISQLRETFYTSMEATSIEKTFMETTAV